MAKRFIDSLKAFYFGRGGALGAILGSLVSEGIAELLDKQGAARFLNTPLNAALYFGTIGAFIALAILVTQSSYFKHGFRNWKALVESVGLGFVAGAAMGLIYSGLKHIDAMPVFISLAIAGGLLGLVLSPRIPNLGSWHGLLGGILAGIMLGGVALVSLDTVEKILNNLAGRLISLAIVGFSAGSTLIFSENTFRKAWLEVRYGTHEIRTVSLGPQSIRLGSDARKCTIYVPNTAPEICRYKLENGQILCKEKATGLVTRLHPGDERKFGNLTITVRAVKTSAERFSLQVGGRNLTLKNDTALTAQVLPGLPTTSPDGVVAEVSRYPKNFRVLGLMNLSSRSWQVTLPNGSQKVIDTGRSVKLADGLKINFGSVQGEVRLEGD